MKEEGARSASFMLPYTRNEPGVMERKRLLVLFKKSRLCVTVMRAPPAVANLLAALISASTLSRSRKLVGSSMIRRWGGTKVSLAKMTQLRCENDKPSILFSIEFMSTEVRSKCERTSAGLALGNDFIMNSKGVSVINNSLVECWQKKANTKSGLMVMEPSVGTIL